VGRVAGGNRSIHLTENVVLETLSNLSVHPEAAIWETGKLQFHDLGHDHTGGDQGAVIDLTANLIANGNFDRCTTPSGYPDHWIPSGYPTAPIITHRQEHGAYFGNYCVYVSGYPHREVGSTPIWSIPHIYQSVPVPSGALRQLPPSGMDYYGRGITIGTYARGTGAFLTGLYSDGFGYTWSYHELDSPTEYSYYKDTFVIGTASGTLSVCLAPSGILYIDNIQATLGTRLPATVPRYNEKDLDAWNRHVDMFLNTSYWPIDPGDVLIYDIQNPSAVAHATKFGQGGVAGVSIGHSSPVSGIPIAVCTLGPTDLNVIGIVSIGDQLFTGAFAGLEGHAISSTYVQANGISLENQFSFGRALEASPGPGASCIMANIYPQGDYYGSFSSGEVIDLVWADVIPIADMGGNNTYRLTSERNENGPVPGQAIILGTDGTPSTSATFIISNAGNAVSGLDNLIMMGEGFLSNGVIVSPPLEVVMIKFQYDGVYWYETSRTYTSSGLN